MILQLLLFLLLSNVVCRRHCCSDSQWIAPLLSCSSPRYWSDIGVSGDLSGRLPCRCWRQVRHDVREEQFPRTARRWRYEREITVILTGVRRRCTVLIYSRGQSVCCPSERSKQLMRKSTGNVVVYAGVCGQLTVNIVVFVVFSYGLILCISTLLNSYHSSKSKRLNNHSVVTYLIFWPSCVIYRPIVR